MVPDGWEEGALGELVSSQQIGTSERGDGAEVTVPLIKMGNLLWGGLDLRQVEEIEESKLAASQYLHPGDVLFNTRNTPELVGKTALWNGELPTATYDNNIARLRFKKEVDPYFITAFMAHGPGKRQIRSRAAGSTSVAAIYWKDLARLRLNFPPLPEQRKIAEILSTWDRAIETSEALLANARTQKRALMQSLLTGKRRFPEFEGQPVRTVSLGDEFDVQLGKMLNKTAREGPEQYLYLTNFNVRWGTFDLSTLNQMHFDHKDRKKFELRSGDLIVCEGGEVGRCAVWREELEDCFYQKALHRVRPKAETDRADYLRFYLEYMAETGRLQHYTGKSSIPHLTRERMQALPIRLPCRREQGMIVDVLAACEAQEQQLKAMIVKVRAEKKALMQQLLTGKRRVIV
ncbi:restriction endonuclease subunit S [Rhodobacteraceae bacterium NNCM2]|nr:restriction endonuclease subunit S [Coraliihabitans acroporae]